MESLRAGRIVLWIAVLFPLIALAAEPHREAPAGPGVESPGPCSAFELALGSTLPGDAAKLLEQLRKKGTVVEATVPFSQAPTPTNLDNPRQVVALEDDGVPKKNSPPLGGRLFFAFNLKCNRPQKKFDVARTEFISWNFRTRRFDFGVVDGLGTPTARAKIVPRAECIVCHRQGGPIFQSGPWTNSTTHMVTGPLFFERLKVLNPAFVPDPLPENEDKLPLVQGFDMLRPKTERFDRTVRDANRVLRQSALPRLEPAEDRPAFTRQWFRAVLQNDESALSPELLADRKFLEARRASAEKFVELVGKSKIPPTAAELQADAIGIANSINLVLGIEGNGDADWLKKAVLEASALRMSASAKAKDPNSPRNQDVAYLPTDPDPYLRKPHGLGERTELRGPLGVKDALLAPVLAAEVKRILQERKKVVSARNYLAVENEILDKTFENEPFVAWAKAGIFPDKHEFVAGFVQAWNRARRKHFGARDDLPSPLPDDDSLAACRGPAEVTQANPSHGYGKCMDCHGDKKKPVAERLKLPFDPYDPGERAAWLAKADDITRRRELVRLREWVFENRTMPPARTPGTEDFRIDSPENASLRQFIETNLPKR